MQTSFNLDKRTKLPKYIQIINSVTNAIRQDKLRKGDQIFSINALSDEFFLSRDTVQKAYNILQQQGIIISVRGKGFYVNRTNINSVFSVLLVFNKISNYKKQIYESFIKTLGSNATVDLKIHHSNTEVFDSIIKNNINDYDYFVIMPHFYDGVDSFLPILKRIPSEKLVLLDRDTNHLVEKYTAVYQDFCNDIINALESGLYLLKKYNKLVLVFPNCIPYPPEIKIGFRSFCMQYNLPWTIIHEVAPEHAVQPGEVYIVIEENDMVNIIKICTQKNLTLGQNVGMISYNEMPVKEILHNGITVISTDHAYMGCTAAKLIIENRKEKIRNPFKLIVRNSL